MKLRLVVVVALLALSGASNKCPSDGSCVESCPNPVPHLPNLNFKEYREQQWFHQINLSYPGLQLVHERPYIFVIENFLSKSECALLIEKANADLKADSFNTKSDNGETKPGTRTSSRSITTDREVAPLRKRISSLANLHDSQIQHLKLSRYLGGEVITRHTDANPGALPRPLNRTQDSINDGGRALHGVMGDSRPGMNRFLTVLTYLNEVEKGGRTRFRWTCYDKWEPIGSFCKDFYIKPTPGHGKASPSGSGKEHDVSIAPRPGMAILFFPATTAATGGITDYNAFHEGEAPAKGHTKYVVQSFTWSLPNANMTKILGPADRQPKKPLTSSIVG